MKSFARVHLVLCVMLLMGCSTQAVYTRESFSADSPFRLKVDDDQTLACESARRSLLGQGYLIDSASMEQVKGHKAYRIEGKANTFIEMNIACVPDGVGSTLYATGLLSTYDLKKSSNPASVGLAGVGSISLPIGQSADALVKVAEETIGDRLFYRRFFAAVQYTLDEMHTYAEAAASAEAAEAAEAAKAAEAAAAAEAAKAAEAAAAAEAVESAATATAAPSPQVQLPVPSEGQPQSIAPESVPPVDAHGAVEPSMCEEASGLPGIDDSVQPPGPACGLVSPVEPSPVEPPLAEPGPEEPSPAEVKPEEPSPSPGP